MDGSAEAELRLLCDGVDPHLGPPNYAARFGRRPPCPCHALLRIYRSFRLRRSCLRRRVAVMSCMGRFLASLRMGIVTTFTWWAGPGNPGYED
jgi:hypothetical protein